MGKGIRQGKTGIREIQRIGAEDPHCLIPVPRLRAATESPCLFVCDFVI
jgi:hypothetical protein